MNSTNISTELQENQQAGTPAVITSETELYYSRNLRGEILRATKAQIQSFGIGAGMAFPGETGGPARFLHVSDPRSYETRISNYNGEQYNVWITYPGREYDEPTFAPPPLPGVRPANTRGWAYDEYEGTADELAAAGLARPDQLPGREGNAKVQLTILNGVIIAKGADVRRRAAGAKLIVRAGKSKYRVIVSISDDECARRAHEFTRAREEWEGRMSELPSPAPLHAVYREMKRLAFLPRKPATAVSPQAFKDSLSGVLSVYLAAARSGCIDAAYRLSDEARSQFEQAAEQLAAVVRNAAVVLVDTPEPEPATRLHDGFWLRAPEAA